MIDTAQYSKKEITIPLVDLRKEVLRIIVPLLLLYIILFVVLWPGRFNFQTFRNAFPDNPLVTIVIILGGIVLHELLHGITWAFFCKKGLRSIRFGIWLKMLTPYCHCREPLKKNHYMAGGFMPGLLLGVAPAVIGIYQGSMGFLLLGLFFSFAAGGDFAMMWKLKHEKKTSLFLDHPNKLGCYLYESRMQKTSQ